MERKSRTRRTRRKICDNYLKGDCMNGTTCHNSHTIPYRLDFYFHCFRYVSSCGIIQEFYTRDGLSYYDKKNNIIYSRTMMISIYKIDYHNVTYMVSRYIKDYNVYKYIKNMCYYITDLIKVIFDIYIRLVGRYDYKLIIKTQ